MKKSTYPEIQLIDGDNFIALNCNHSYDETLNKEDLYENIRGCWRVNPKHANKTNYVLIIKHGIVKAMFEATWGEKVIVGKRNTKWKFYKEKEIKNHPYLNTNISDYIKFNGNPVQYYGIQ